MDYAEARAAFFQPRPDSGAPDDDAPGRRLRHAIEPIATIHYWSEPASVAYGEIGLDFLGGYVGSRGCVLGDASGAVVAALRRGVEAADPTARALFAGSADVGFPGEPLADLWHACTTLREFRGDSHLAVCVAHGISGLAANLLTEARVGWEQFTYTGTRGWSPEAMRAAVDGEVMRRLYDNGTLTPAGVELRDRIEEDTERAMSPVLAAIGSDLDAVVDATSAWSQQIVDAGWFPPDPFKRASG